MGEPQRFYSSRILDVPPPEGVTPPDDREKQRVDYEEELLRRFDHLPSQIKTDLKCWMTFSPETRAGRTKWFGGKEGGVGSHDRAEILLYIIRQEKRHPLGDSQVAALAFRALFPNHVPKGAKPVNAS